MEKGTKVVVTGQRHKDAWDWHPFKEGAEVVSTGRSEWGRGGEWHQFTSKSGEEEWFMLPEHYKVVAVEAPTSGEAIGKSAELTKAKMVYVVYEKDEFVYATPDREDARGLKADLGGKRDGIKILAYNLAKEIR